MADTGKNSPLGVNVTGDYMDNTGFTINPVAQSYMGISKRNATYSFGSCVSGTCLRLLTWSIHDAYNRGVVLKSPAGTSVYDNLISIGKGTIPALGNSIPPTYVPVDPAGVWARSSTTATLPSFAEQYGRQNANAGGYSPNDVLPGPATSGYGNYDGSYGDPLQGVGLTDQKQNATWYPYNMTNPNHSVTQWGWIRCYALQAWNEFNWNGIIVDPSSSLPSYLQGYQVPDYSEFLGSVTLGQSYIGQANQSIIATYNANDFLDGTYSNMNDLISSDIAGVSLSTIAFGTDLENLGMALDLATIDSFGLPSNLLRTLGNQGAITEDLSLVLLATGLNSVEISDIAEGIVTNPTEEQERKIYGAFLLMTGENLQGIIAPIQCRTQGLQTLADLLDVKKLFPNSYQSLTVPMYNATPGPTNSKTYYLIYNGTGVNPALSSPVMREYVGTLTPAGNPPILETSTSPKNYREVPTGFDSYLAGILPADQAIAAGAFNFTMRQINSVNTFDIALFAKVVKGIENVSNLPLTAGTSKPTNQQMIDQSTRKGSLGTGPYGSYTMSDLFGCMSGLPYPWKLTKGRINQLETKKLYNIYHELFLAVTWEGASVTVIPETRQVPIPGTDPVQYYTEYRVGSFAVANPGGGYGRGTAPDPIITASNGGSGTGIVGRDDSSAASLGGGSFGRITGCSMTNPGSWQLSPPTATIQYPPTGGLPVTESGAFATDGTNTLYGTTGWTQPMNGVVSAYIGQANQEIAEIQQKNTVVSNYLNTYWSAMGTQLLIEHRVRYKAFSPVAVPKDMFGAPYPSSLLNTIDYIPQLSQDTKPHMAAQFLEAISDNNTVGGQSTVAMMRQERNKARLQLLGIEQDNSIPDGLTDDETKQLTANGTLPGAVVGSGISSPAGGILGEPGTTSPTEYTLPAWPSNILNNVEVSPVPGGSYVPTNSNRDDVVTGFQTSNEFAPGDINQILDNVPDPVAGPIIPVGPNLTENPYGGNDGAGGVGGTTGPGAGIGPGAPGADGVPGVGGGAAGTGTAPGVGGGAAGTGTAPGPGGVTGFGGTGSTPYPIIIQPAPEYDPNNLPPYLDPRFTRSTLLPSVPTVKEAIDRVIECNCDCWVN